MLKKNKIDVNKVTSDWKKDFEEAYRLFIQARSEVDCLEDKLWTLLFNAGVVSDDLDLRMMRERDIINLEFKAVNALRKVKRLEDYAAMCIEDKTAGGEKK